MLLLLALSLCLVSVNGLLPETWTAPGVDFQSHAPSEANIGQNPTALSDLFREVKKLVEDTQRKLEDAEQQMDNESTKSIQPIHNITSNYSNESSSEIVTGNRSVPAAEAIDKISHNSTEKLHMTRSVNQSSGKENDDHECIIDEDCEKGKYCLYEEHHSGCMPCKRPDAICRKDEECCEGQLCVLGRCMNSTKGEAGTICQEQNDCDNDLCCAFYEGLLFPVCIPKPKEREPCSISTNHLMDLLSWDLGHRSPKEHCPCTGDLQCQHLGHSLVCLKAPTSSEEALSDTLYAEIDYII
ncbi:dickkopf-related protein 3-like [Clarias magur]|uniref:Dickkopf-related protein 3-like n=1 Tax=Clarias magur TaxID=1594786 RepID=A0A8J4U3G9_CLAMG|nr:dickkopf-related protein 3-like [Clarias magur]